MNNGNLLKVFGLFIALLFSYLGYGQENTVLLSGKVQSLNYDIENVLIINTNTKNTTITDGKGLFTLEVILRDTIQFSAVHYLKKQII